MDLTPAALAELRRLAVEVGSSSPDDPEFQILWDNRLVMGDHERCHITARGKQMLEKLAVSGGPET